jgi:hypothetical protein
LGLKKATMARGISSNTKDALWRPVARFFGLGHDEIIFDNTNFKEKNDP